ncbi:MAG: polyprenyl synthetase family protein, partial [Maritimibacter sp.]|nr:polyprenyl synthetase family protein [Maritimibacter sp.]
LQLTAATDIRTGEDVYLQIARGKTAALFAAACEVGGVIAGAEPQAVAALAAYGDAMGIAFQIADDLLDFWGGDGIGKNKGDDFRERKLTLPMIKAIAVADDGERAFWERTIGQGRQAEGDLAEALRLMEAHGTLEATRKEALGWSDRAKAALENLPQDPIRDMLADIADYVVARLN